MSNKFEDNLKKKTRNTALEHSCVIAVNQQPAQITSWNPRRTSMVCLQMKSLRLNDRHFFSRWKTADSLTSVVHFYSKRLFFFCVWWSALIYSLLSRYQSVCHCSFCLASFPRGPSQAPPPRELLLTCSIYYVLYVTAASPRNLRSTERSHRASIFALKA